MIAIASASGSFLVAPNAGLLVWTGLAILSVICGLVTAAKGRWGWLAAGFLSVGVLWIVGAVQPARPDSLWARLSAAPRSLP